jgi:hypothetical protein
LDAAAWQTTAPEQAGTWLLQCLENDGRDEEIVVELACGVLMCECEIGLMPVQMLHDGLTQVRWRQAAGSHRA